LARAVRQGHGNEATRVAHDLLPRPDSEASFRGVPPRTKVGLLLPVALELSAAERKSDALQFADPVVRSAYEIENEGERSRALGGLAVVYARCGRLAQARNVADRCQRSLDKLRGYAAIVAAGPHS